MAATSPTRPLQRSGSGTLYAQVHESLLELIQSDGYRPGDQIPTESELMEMFGVGRMTVRRALDELRRQGIVDRRPGLGTFILEPPMDARIRGVHSLTDEVVQLGMTPGSRLLGQSRGEATAEIARNLEIHEGADVLQLDRVRTANGRPFFVATSHINLSTYPQLVGIDYTDPSLSLLATYERVLGLVPVRMTQLTSATLAPPIAQNVFEISAQAPVLLLERTVYLEEGPPVEYVSAYFRGDTYKFYNEIS